MMCPYCNIRELLPGGKTCGDPMCQHLRHKEKMREYAKRYYYKYVKPMVEKIIDKIA